MVMIIIISIMCLDHTLKQLSNIKVDINWNTKQMNTLFNVVINTEEKCSI